MRRTVILAPFAVLMVLICVSYVTRAQPGRDGPRGERAREFGPPGSGPEGFGPPGGGGPGPQREDILLVDQFDENDDGWLNHSERAKARREAKDQAADRPQRRGPRGRGRQANQEPPKPGKQITPAEVQSVPDAELYDRNVLRTLFFEFENDDWETELSDFYNTDVEVPATLLVDGKKYPNVGVRFRGASSYFTVPAGRKRSFNVSIDMADSDQRLNGYRTLNLLNSNGDSSLMSTVLYSEIANKHLPAPKANFVRVVINGESWGIYVNVQQFNKDFLKEHYGTKKGTRWKVPGSPRGDGGLRYLGEDEAEYRDRFAIKPSDNDHAWQDLIELCRVLNETPADELVAALEPLLDIESALRFLAIDVALVNSDGYWVRASDYSIYQDTDGKFHLIPHDMNEAFLAGSHRGPGGGRGRGPRGGQRGRGGPPPGEGPPPAGPPPRDRPPRSGQAGGFPGRGSGRPGGGGVTLDPLVGLDNDRMPLRSKLLAVPELKSRYLSYVREIAQDSLDWQKMEPRILAFRDLLKQEVKADTRQLSSYEDFLRATDPRQPAAEKGNTDNHLPESLRDFFERRQGYLLEQTRERT